MKKKKEYYCMRRPCDRCEKPFRPATKMTRICEKCLIKGHKERMERNKIKREKMKVKENAA